MRNVKSKRRNRQFGFKKNNNRASDFATNHYARNNMNKGLASNAVKLNSRFGFEIEFDAINKKEKTH
jgi:hypothetical protein